VVPVVADKPAAGAQAYVTAPVPVRVVVEPAQLKGDEQVIPTGILPPTVISTVVEPVHPLTSVPVTLYVVVVVGLAVTIDPVVEDKPVPGAHK